MTIFRTIAVIIAGLAFATAAHAKRVALVVGNSEYQHVSALPNPKNDAKAMAAKFKSLGFDVVEGYDLDQSDLTRKLRTFAKAANSAEISAVFYAGHGIQEPEAIPGDETEAAAGEEAATDDAKKAAKSATNGRADTKKSNGRRARN